MIDASVLIYNMTNDAYPATGISECVIVTQFKYTLHRDKKRCSIEMNFKNQW